MSDQKVTAGVREVTRLQQVSVIVLAHCDGVTTLDDSLDEVCASVAPVVVIECVEAGTLTRADRDAIIAANRQLRSSRRHLIVVNAAIDDVIELQRGGVEVAETTDQVFPDVPVVDGF
jgi:hypothetical protein